MKYIINERVPGTDGWKWRWITYEAARKYLMGSDTIIIMDENGNIVKFETDFDSPLVISDEPLCVGFAIDPGTLVVADHHLGVRYTCSNCKRVVFQLIPGRSHALPYRCPLCKRGDMQPEGFNG